MDLKISLSKTLALRDQGVLLVDARSPGEYADATIPGAINVPILDDDERAEIGALYKQHGKAAARQRGVDIVAPKIPVLVAKVAEARTAQMPVVVVFCWRGGMRSRALAQFLDLAGIPARQLQGGHKAFRRLVIGFFAQGSWGRLIVLRGLTGVGKTKVLHLLAEQGQPTIDLEGLANHRGSVFGNLGLDPQPSQKMFEALLWDELRHVSKEDYVLVEGESRYIGRLILPKRFHQDMQLERTIWLNAPLDTRVQNILADYPARDELSEQFVLPIKALKERLGTQVMNEFLGLLEKGDWAELARQLMLRYYDPLYRHTLPVGRLDVDIDPLEEGLLRVHEAIRTILESSHESASSDQALLASLSRR